MNSRLARTLTRLYPTSWRERYGAEFTSFLEMDPGGVRSITDVIWSVFHEHLMSAGEFLMKSPQNAMGIVAVSFLAAIAAGVNLVATVDDSALVPLMRSNAGMNTTWNLVALAAIFCAFGVAALVVPLYSSIARFAWVKRRNGIILRLCVPVLGLGVLIFWGGAGLVYSGGSWAPSPWAILSSGGAPLTWPGLPVRWICGTISVFLIVAFLAGSAASFMQTIRLTLDETTITTSVRKRTRTFGLAIQLVSISTFIMTVATLIWGLIVQARVPNLFSQHFGVLGSSAFVSWLISFFLFALASIIAIHGNRAFHSTHEANAI